MIDAVLDKYDLNIPTEAEKAISEACGEIARIRNQVSREVFAVNLSDKFRLPPHKFFDRIEKIRKNHIEEDRRIAQEAMLKEAIRADPEEAILGALLYYSELYKDVKDILGEEFFSNEFYQRIFNYFKNNIEVSSSFDMAVFNQDFSTDEIGNITKITLSEAAAKFLNNPESLKNYINNFIKHKKSSTSFKEIATSGNDRDFEDEFDKIRQKKLLG
jgi:hypothetical protein